MPIFKSVLKYRGTRSMMVCRRMVVAHFGLKLNRQCSRRGLAGHGLAVPYRDCKCEVVRDAADMARLERVGIWSGTFVMPWEWQKANK